MAAPLPCAQWERLNHAFPLEMITVIPCKIGIQRNHTVVERRVARIGRDSADALLQFALFILPPLFIVKTTSSK